MESRYAVSKLLNLFRQRIRITFTKGQPTGHQYSESMLLHLRLAAQRSVVPCHSFLVLGQVHLVVHRTWFEAIGHCRVGEPGKLDRAERVVHHEFEGCRTLRLRDLG